MTEYTISLQAYAKAVLHCAKYPWATVHGLFLAEKKDGKVRMVDAIPLAHNWTQLTPMFDVALQQAQVYAKTKGWSIGGYYVAYEDTETTQLSASGTLLARAVSASSEGVVAFVIDAKKLGPGSAQPGLVPYLNVDSQWKEQSGAFSGAKSKGGAATFVLENNRVLASTLKLVAERADIGIHDFDEHLDDVTLDWLQNNALSERIRTA
ncbi:hypothetical protein GGH94_001224 [Coemansia aciculifera]|uniref:Uncharacterized protein n=1 Tax=Coemansia aciculifera TaxID=417176 RepID=A0A9W8IV65_9FUNG|nr:hypothetical protein GGH94_001224 [Coemansia aciculifera]KAJ2876071.1 hypothetical protein GGH93_001100 [Coemansia aciculifera]KAJ2882221.1 hypothetical protein H4R27_003588 [Coemansia aciculifera]